MQTTAWYNGVQIYKGTRIRNCDLWYLECNLMKGDHFTAKKRNVTIGVRTGQRNFPKEMFSPGKYRVQVMVFDHSGKVLACAEADATLI